MNTSLQIKTEHPSLEAMEKALAGNLKDLTTAERLQFLKTLCESVGLNPLTQPFEFVELKGKLKLYPKSGCAEQLRKIHGVSIKVTERARDKGVYWVRVEATDAAGRTDEAIGAVPMADNAGGEFVADAMMKAETKAKRRVTFSICGLGFQDFEDMRNDTMKPVHGEIVDEGETIADKVARLNQTISDAKSSPASPQSETATVPPITLSEPVSAGASFTPEPSSDPDWSVSRKKPVAPPQPVIEVLPAPSEPLLDEETEVAIEKLINTAPQPASAVEYLIAKGKLPKGKSLAHLDKAYAKKMLDRPSQWIAAVVAATK